MIEDPDPFAIPDPVLARIREVVPHSIPDQARPEDRNEPMPYQRPEGLLPIPGPNTERGFAVTPVPKSTSGTIGSFVGQVSVSPDTLLNDFPDDMDGQTPKILSVSDATEIYAHATVDGAGVVTARVVAAGASVPDDDPESGDFYWHLASVTMATDGADNVPVITVDQIRWGPIEELQRYYREFHIQPSGAYRAIIYNGTLFGGFPDNFSVDNAPFRELTGLANGDKIYAAITWDKTVKTDGATAITSRTIEKAATVPANVPLDGLFYFELASVALDVDNFPVVSQTRWGPIDVFPGTASNPYLMPPSPGTQTTAQTDYWNLTETGKGKDTGEANLAPTYDSVSLNKTGFVRFVTEDGALKAFVRPATINSIGQIVLAGPEDLAVDFPPLTLTLEFGTLGYTGGTPGGTITGTWNDGFTLDLLLPYTVFGTAVTGSPGSSASVSGQGTSGDPLIFTIPRGDVGETGPTGATGATGTVEMGYLEELHTIGGSDFDGTQDVTSFPVPGPIGGTTPNTAEFTKVTINSTGSDKCIQASSDSGTCVEASSYSGCALSGASTTGDLLDLSGGSGGVLNVSNAGKLRHNGAVTLEPQTLAPALNASAACSVATATTNFALNGTNALSLGNPSGGREDGTVKILVCTAVTAAGTATLTPTSCSGFSTVAFTAAGQSLVLQYFNTGGWVILSVRGATPA